MFKKIGLWITAVWAFLKGKKRWITITYGGVAASAVMYFQIPPTSKTGIWLFCIGIALSVITGGHGVFRIMAGQGDDSQDEDASNIQKSTT
jgi:hypothetical protein